MERILPLRGNIILFLLLLSSTVASAFQTAETSLSPHPRHRSKSTSIFPSKIHLSHRPRNRIIHGEELGRRSNRRVAVHSIQLDAAWKSCPQPRFDEFASSTIGPWMVLSSSSTTSPPTTSTSPASLHTHNKAYEVEEVMRSCGGAVQGIREIPLSCIFPEVANDNIGAIAEERTYHNRADGGFVYFDDGSYSAGLEQWDWGSITKDEVCSSDLATYPKSMMASLAFPNRRRVWVTSTLSELSIAASAVVDEGEESRIEVVSCRAMDLVRPTSAVKDDVSDESRKSTGESIVSTFPPSVHWKTMQRVRMPSASQPWSLPRAKWECKVSSEGEGNDDETKNNYPVVDFGESAIYCWAFVECMPGNDGIFGDIISSDGHINMHMLAVCSTSNVARSVVRHYDTNGVLKSVAFLEGVLSMDNCE